VQEADSLREQLANANRSFKELLASKCEEDAAHDKSLRQVEALVAEADQLKRDIRALKQDKATLNEENGRLNVLVQSLKNEHDHQTQTMEEREEQVRATIESQKEAFETLSGDQNRVNKDNGELKLLLMKLQSQLDAAHRKTLTIITHFEDGMADDLIAAIHQAMASDGRESAE
jgi:DNA repair exonuclease SbcCD ATPase subunit